jgi:hypothetical protein
MKLAYVSVPGRGLTDDVIAEAVAAFMADGLRIVGTVRTGAADPQAHACDMDLRVLPNGPDFRISQPLGAGSRGCRLDAGAIAAIASAVEAAIPDAAILVINKFGKLEAQGRGLCPAMVMASERDIPVLVGVNALNLTQFQTFVGGFALPLPPDPSAIRAWFEWMSRRSGQCA